MRIIEKTKVIEGMLYDIQRMKNDKISSNDLSIYLKRKAIEITGKYVQ